MSAGDLGLPDFFDSTRFELARQAACDAASLADLIVVQLEGTDEIASKAMAIRISQLLSVAMWSLQDGAADVPGMYFDLYNTRMTNELEASHG